MPSSVLSIGCGAAWWEIKTIFEKPVAQIYLLDSNPVVLNQEDVQEGIDYFSKIFQIPFPATYHLLIQEAKDIPIPKNSLNEIWFFNSLHEIDNTATCLQECFQLLKKNGTVFIEEELSIHELLMHDGCNKPLYFFEELDRNMKAAGFHYLSQEKKDDKTFYLTYQKP